MRFLFWNIELVRPAQKKQTTANVRIVLRRNPNSYSVAWVVLPNRGEKPLTRLELHALEMRVEKYVATLHLTPPAQPEESTIFVSL